MPRLRRGWALVRVQLVGICNTDVELLRGYYNFRGVPGHEFVGTVEEVRGVASAAKKKWPGAYAEYLTLPLDNLHAVPDGVSDEQAVFVEPLAAACEILEQVDVRKVREAAVLGDGKLAQLIARVLRATIPRVVMFGKHERKMDLACRAGITTKKVRGNVSDLKLVQESFRLVVEATGSPTGLALAQQIIEPRGTLVLKSTFHGAAPVETWPIVVKEITIVGSRCGPFAKAITLLRSGEIDPTPLITRTFPLSHAPTALRFAQQRGVMKVLLKPESDRELTQSSQRAQRAGSGPIAG